MTQELSRYRSALSATETAAKKQPWAKERPWKARTHVVVEHDVVVVDLHDLKANLARKTVKAVVATGPSGQGVVVFVVGRGRHSMGPGGVLGKVVVSALGSACKDQDAWSVRWAGPARVAWITDWSRAPKSVVGGGDWSLWLLFGLLAVPLLFAFVRSLGLFGG